jgi:hypothetical protein
MYTNYLFVLNKDFKEPWQDTTVNTTEKFNVLSAKSLSSRMETHVVAVSFKDGNEPDSTKPG